MNDRLKDIFDHKRVSSAQFRAVQKKHGLILTDDLMYANPETREGAIELHKGIHWINLELSEFLGATEAERPEELADVLHFLVELSLLAEVDYTALPASRGEDADRLDIILNASANDAFVFQDPETNARFTILAALRLAELVKNKPWKQTLRTDLDLIEFTNRLLAIWYWFGATVRTAGIEAQDLYDNFVTKEKINYQRIATGV